MVVKNEKVDLKRDIMKKENVDISNRTTQENVYIKAQRIADCMVAKKMRGMPTKEELTAYREWVKNKNLSDQKYHEELCYLQKQIDILQNENKRYRYKLMIVLSNVKLEFIDFVTYTVCNKLIDSQDFAKELRMFLQNNPQYVNDPSFK